MKSCLALILFLASGRAQEAGEIRGRVVDSRGGEPLARVLIQLEPTTNLAVTDEQGQFAFHGVGPGTYILHASTVGYRLVKETFALAPGESKEFEIVMNSDTLRRTDSIEVRAGPFEVARQDSPAEMTLQGTELTNLASVLADDPLRAVQGMPGVTSNDDFNSYFSLRGADYSRIGLYLDGVLLHLPFHAVQEVPGSGSITIFNGDQLDSLELHAGAFPARYADRTAGILDAHTREGTRLRPVFRATASASNAAFLGEGPLGQGRHGDWLASVRKSYLEYVLRRVSSDPSLAFGFFDSQGKIAYDLTPRHSVSLSYVDGFSSLDRTHARNRLGLNSVMTSHYHFTVANLAWRYAPHEHFFLTQRAAYIRERFENHNPTSLDLASGQYGEWVWNGEGTWLWAGSQSLDFGWILRRLRDDGFVNQYQFNPFAIRQLNAFRGTGWQTGGFLEQSWRVWGGRLRPTLGLRTDEGSVDRIQTVSPQSSLGLVLRPGTSLHLGWGQYVQYPEFDWLFSPLGNRGLLPERANHLELTIEQRLDDRTRLRVDFYNRQDRDLLFRLLYEPRLIAGQVFNPPLNPPISNALRGYARGVEIFLQRRSANRLSGWVSYALGYSRVRHDAAPLAPMPRALSFPSDNDQRHTVNVYLSYRATPTVNLSIKSIYGSGFPIPGFYRREGNSYFLSESRNAIRLDPYARTDVRINKAYVFDRWKVTLYGEIVNLLNRRNLRLESFNGYNASTGEAYLNFLKMFPILPSAGVVLEF